MTSCDLQLLGHGLEVVAEWSRLASLNRKSSQRTRADSPAGPAVPADVVGALPPRLRSLRAPIRLPERQEFGAGRLRIAHRRDEGRFIARLFSIEAESPFNT